MAKQLILTLTDEQQRELTRTRDHHALPHMREKAAALLKIAAGASGRAVAQHGLLRPRRTQTIYGWVHRYRAAGLAGLLVQEGRGRKPAFSPSAPGRSGGANSAPACSAAGTAAVGPCPESLDPGPAGREL